MERPTSFLLPLMSVVHRSDPLARSCWPGALSREKWPWGLTPGPEAPGGIACGPLHLGAAGPAALEGEDQEGRVLMQAGFSHTGGCTPLTPPWDHSCLFTHCCKSPPENQRRAGSFRKQPERGRRAEEGAAGVRAVARGCAWGLRAGPSERPLRLSALGDGRSSQGPSGPGWTASHWCLHLGQTKLHSHAAWGSAHGARLVFGGG